MLSVFYGLVSLVLVCCGVWCAYEARSYTDEQRTRAPRLVGAYLGCGVLMSIAGAGSLVWLLSGGSIWAVNAVAVPIAALPCFVQYLLHRKLDSDQSPLADRLGTAVARTFNFPDH